MNIDEIYQSPFFKAADLDHKTQTFTIKEIRSEPFLEGVKPGARFEETNKRFIFNKTNLKLTAKILGSKETNDWIGEQIGLMPVIVDFKGEPVEAIRVTKPVRPSITDQDIPF